MLQSRQPTLTRRSRVSLPPVCSALLRRVRDDTDDRPDAPELLAAIACALALALPVSVLVSADVCLLSRPTAPDLLATRARSPAPSVCLPPSFLVLSCLGS
jgi:hypothetical protein